MKISCADIIFQEMTILEELNIGNLEAAMSHASDDFKGITFDGKSYEATMDFAYLMSKQNIIITEETFDCIRIDNNTMRVTYFAYSEYAKDIVKHTSIWKLTDNKLQMSEHCSVIAELKY